MKHRATNEPIEMNLKITLPRMPARLTRMLDQYSTWAEQPVLRRDLVSIGVIAGVCSVYSLWVGAEAALMLGVPSGVLAWIAIENWYAT
jgi:hypothetical protein